MPEVLLRYRYPDGRLQAALPLHVVEDREDRVVGWMPVGTEISYWAAENGSDPRTIPLEDRFVGRLGTAPRTWTGGGVLRVIPIHASWQAIHFWDMGTGDFSSWYVNLESPKRRRGPVLDAVDRHLDLVIDPLLRPSWKDEDEAAAAVKADYLSGADLDAARAAGERIAADPRAWVDEVGDWRDFRPDPAWGPLRLPVGWDSD